MSAVPSRVVRGGCGAFACGQAGAGAGRKVRQVLCRMCRCRRNCFSLSSQRRSMSDASVSDEASVWSAENGASSRSSISSVSDRELERPKRVTLGVEVGSSFEKKILISMLTF